MEDVPRSNAKQRGRSQNTWPSTPVESICIRCSSALGALRPWAIPVCKILLARIYQDVVQSIRALAVAYGSCTIPSRGDGYRTARLRLA
jgi:hypothetical protein